MKTNEISLTIVFSSLYAVLIIVLAPISYGPVQLRVADCLIPLAALFGWPAIAGVTVGCFFGNAYFWMGPQDVILGAVANLVAATVIFLLRKRPFLAVVVGSLPIGFIVGSYLWLFFDFQVDIFGLLIPSWAAMIASVTLSTLIVMSGIGFAILKTLSGSSFIQLFKSWGIKVYNKE